MFACAGYAHAVLFGKMIAERKQKAGFVLDLGSARIEDTLFVICVHFVRLALTVKSEHTMLC